MELKQDIKLFILAFVISSTLLIIIPSPDFPLNDEWMFARSVNNFLDTGVVSCDGCTTSGVLLVAIGGILSKAFGFSFDLLRSTIIIFASLSVATSYLLIKEVTGIYRLSFFASLFLLANPIFYNISHLFMTDVPFIFLALLSSYFAIRGLRDNDNKQFIFLAVTASAAVFLRQIALAIPLAIIIYATIFQKKSLRNTYLWVSILLPGILLGFFMLGQVEYSGQFYSQEFDVKYPIGISKEGFYNTWSSVIYFGFFFLPLAFMFHRYVRDKIFISILAFFAITAIVANLFLAPFFQQALHMPYLSNIMNENSVGSVNIPGKEGKDNFFPDIFWVLATALSIVATSVLLTEVLYKFKGKAPSKEAIIILVIAGSFLLTVFLKSGAFFDRYIVIFIPLLAFVFVERLRSSRVLIAISIAYLVFLTLFSVIGTMDYVNWNEVRWQEISNLESGGVNKSDINGGFEFCLYNYGMKFQYEYWREIGIFDYEGSRPHDWKFCPNDDYVISFSEAPSDFASSKSYVVEKSVNYCLYGNVLCDTIFVLKSI